MGSLSSTMEQDTLSLPKHIKMGAGDVEMRTFSVDLRLSLNFLSPSTDNNNTYYSYVSIYNVNPQFAGSMNYRCRNNICLLLRR